MGRLAGCILKTRVDIRFFQVRKVLQNFLWGHPTGKHFEHVAHRDSHTANRRLTTAHVRFDCDTLQPHDAILYKGTRKAKYQIQPHVSRR
jgi:hypothetical protein